MLVVVEPGWASLETAARVLALARDLGIGRVCAVANKVRTDEDAAFVRRGTSVPVAGVLPYDAGLEVQARSGAYDPGTAFHLGVIALARQLEASSTEVETREAR
jgi:CO dehydrogenase maturation factor